MLFIYPAIFHKENNSYWVEFPYLEGCQTYGDTLNETMEYAQEALYSNLPLAQPSDISSLSYGSDSFITLVTCDINRYKDTKAVKKTLTIPAWLNERALAMNINFSQVLQEALLAKIQAK